MFISKIKIFTSNTSGNNKEMTFDINNSSDVEMKNNDDDNGDTTTSEKFNSIKIIKSKIFNDQRTELEN